MRYSPHASSRRDRQAIVAHEAGHRVQTEHIKENDINENDTKKTTPRKRIREQQ
jgi:hypothetical protein